MTCVNWRNSAFVCCHTTNLSYVVNFVIFLAGEQFSLPSSLPEGPLNPSLGVDSGKKGSHKEVHVTVSSKTLMDISCKLSNQLRELLVGPRFVMHQL